MVVHSAKGGKRIESCVCMRAMSLGKCSSLAGMSMPGGICGSRVATHISFMFAAESWLRYEFDRSLHYRRTHLRCVGMLALPPHAHTQSIFTMFLYRLKILLSKFYFTLLLLLYLKFYVQPQSLARQYAQRGSVCLFAVSSSFLDAIKTFCIMKCYSGNRVNTHEKVALMKSSYLAKHSTLSSLDYYQRIDWIDFKWCSWFAYAMSCRPVPVQPSVCTLTHKLISISVTATNWHSLTGRSLTVKSKS